MIDLRSAPEAGALSGSIDEVFRLAGGKIRSLAARSRPGEGAPVFTVEGKYTARGWTEWTQGFQFGGALYVFEATGDPWFLDYSRSNTAERMASHVTHAGVHDHGFNNVSSYGGLLRLMSEGAIGENPWERRFYELALKASGAVQAARWTALPGGLGYIYSFNGPHSLFADTIRSLRSLAIAHILGHALMAERDEKVSLLRRLLQHAETTARYNVYFGEGRDRWDVRGRTAHESIFNLNDGSYRCPSSQQGYSPFTTWTRGLAWILLGYAEELEFLSTVDEDEFPRLGLPYFPDKGAVIERFAETAKAAADFYLENTPTDGIPYWDTGAPGLRDLGDWLGRPAEPFNDSEPVDSSAAAIAAQGLLRLGDWLNEAAGRGGSSPEPEGPGTRYVEAGLVTARTLMAPPYLSRNTDHEGLLLHSIYHRPNAWDNVPEGKKIPSGESCMWGDYHLLELAALLARRIGKRPSLRFFNVV